MEILPGLLHLGSVWLTSTMLLLHDTRMGSDGARDQIHAVDLENGGVFRSYKIDIPRIGDWESISLGPCGIVPGNDDSADIKAAAAAGEAPRARDCLYIGNTGDNVAIRCQNRTCTGGRSSQIIYKLEEPDVNDETLGFKIDESNSNGNSPDDVVRVEVASLIYTYFDPSFPTNQANSGAMFVDYVGDGDEGDGEEGDIYIITKQPYQRNLQRVGRIRAAEHSQLQPGDRRFVRMESVSNTPKGISVKVPWTGADMSRDGRLIAARRESRVYFFAREPGQSVGDAMQASACPYVSGNIPR
jgi:hypothetical protein